MATIEDFQKVDIRVGKIVEVDDFPEARKPMYKFKIDFGPEIGVKNSSAQLVGVYSEEELMGKVVLGVVHPVKSREAGAAVPQFNRINFPPRQIGPFASEVLTLGVPDADGKCVLIIPDRDTAEVGGRMF